MDALRAIDAPEMSTAEVVYLRAQLLYVVLLLAFIVSAGVNSIVTARTEEELVVPTAKGPGGKPLPVTKKRKREQLDEPRVPDACAGSCFVRRIFQYTTAAVILSFFANGGAIALRALQYRRTGSGEGWWCSEERTVSLAQPLWGEKKTLMSTQRSTLLVLRSCMSTCSSRFLTGKGARMLCT